MSTRAAPVSVRFSSVGIFLFPFVLCVIGFRLYAHPKNPDAWFVWGVFQVVYGVGALLVLKGFGFVRWLWAFSLAMSIIFGAGRIVAMWQSPYSYLAVWVCVAVTLKIVLLTLLFVPSANAFFRGDEGPNQSTTAQRASRAADR